MSAVHPIPPLRGLINAMLTIPTTQTFKINLVSMMEITQAGWWEITWSTTCGYAVIISSMTRSCSNNVQAIDKDTSLIVEDLDKAVKKDDAGDELLEVVQNLNFHVNPSLRDILPPPSLNKMSKSDRIKKLTEF